MCLRPPTRPPAAAADNRRIDTSFSDRTPSWYCSDEAGTYGGIPLLAEITGSGTDPQSLQVRWQVGMGQKLLRRACACGLRRKLSAGRWRCGPHCGAL